MTEVTVSERERLEWIKQGENIFLEAKERLYNANKQRSTESKDKLVATLDTFTVFGTLDEVTELFLNDKKKMVLDFSESRDIIVLKPQTSQRPRHRTSLRWSLSYSPSRLLANDQDFCYLEVMKPYGTQDGRCGWARILHSIQHEACPEPANDVNRAELIYCGVFFEETDKLGVLTATVNYNIKSNSTPSVLMPIVRKARNKRFMELVNHYLKMSNMILKSKTISLTRALQLQGEKRCAACAHHLSMWKSKINCVMCGSYMCDKCSDIVVRNYRVDGVARGQVTCFSCSHRRATKTTQEIGSCNLDYSGPADFIDTENDGRLRDTSISSYNTEQCPKWFDDPGKLSLEVARNQVEQKGTPLQRGEPSQLDQWQKILKQTSCNSEFTPQQTIFLQTDHDEVQRRRCKTRVTSQCQPKAWEKDFVGRHRSRTTGNSKLSNRAKPTGCAPEKEVRDVSMEEPVDVALVGVDLEVINGQLRRYTSNAISVQPMELIEPRVRAASRSHTVDGTCFTQSSCCARPSAPAFSAVKTDVSSARYSKQNPCNRGYLANFK